MIRIGQILVVPLLFALITLSILTDFPDSVFDPPYSRGLRMMDGIVDFFTSTFGTSGGALVSALLGVVASAFVGWHTNSSQGISLIDRIGSNFGGDSKPLSQSKLQVEPQTASPQGFGRKRSVDQIVGTERLAAKTLSVPVAASPNTIAPSFVSTSGYGGADITANRAIEQARGNAILMSRYYDPQFSETLSFYGGTPLAPPTLQWPSYTEDNQTILMHFLMQWDCRKLSALDQTGYLPKDGVLYLFADTRWGNNDRFRFIHMPTSSALMQRLSAPKTLPPLLGDEGAWQSPYVVCSGLDAEKRKEFADDAPHLLPYWPMETFAFPCPIEPGEDEEEEDDSYTERQNDFKERLLALEASRREKPPILELSKYTPFARPYPAFPQDWAAVRILAADLLEKTTSVSSARSIALKMLDSSPEEIATARQQWKDEAVALYRHARNFPLTTVPDQASKDQIWSTIERFEFLIRLGFDKVVEESVNVSLGIKSDAIKDIPQSWIERVENRFRFASLHVRQQYEREFLNNAGKDMPREEGAKLYKARKEQNTLPMIRDIFMSNPTQMFGSPSGVQGYAEEYVDEWMLLLELDSQSIDGLPLGEGVLQFMIRPDDLKSGRFEQVKLIASAY